MEITFTLDKLTKNNGRFKDGKFSVIYLSHKEMADLGIKDSFTIKIEAKN